MQILPPELLGEGQKDKIETREPQPYFKPSSLKDGESEEFRLMGCYETGHAVTGWQYPSEKVDEKGLIVPSYAYDCPLGNGTYNIFELEIDSNGGDIATLVELNPNNTITKEDFQNLLVTHRSHLQNN